MIRFGLWCVYHGYECRISNVFHSRNDIVLYKEQMKKWRKPIYDKYFKELLIEPGDVLLLSYDKEQLKDGFYPYSDDKNGFTCIKTVQKDKITVAYEYNTYAFYKGIKCDISGPVPQKNEYFLKADYEVRINVDYDLVKKLQEYGFKQDYAIGYGTFLFEKNVSSDDPDLQIFEERTEIDVNSL